MVAFLSDYDNALSRAESLDSQVLQAAANVSTGNQYWNMLSLAARQVFGALDLTAPGSDGTTRFFMKDIGRSRSACLPQSPSVWCSHIRRRVNPVENLYAALPIFLYFNSSMVKPLLEPLLEQQASSSYTSSFAASDIGEIETPWHTLKFLLTCWQVPRTHPSLGQQRQRMRALSVSVSLLAPIALNIHGEIESANMLIMVLAHATHSSDSSLVKTYVRVHSLDNVYTRLTRV